MNDEQLQRYPGFDLTLRPPKSVSILWALGKPEWSVIVADAHRQAVDEVVNYYEDNAVFSRKRIDGEQLRIDSEGTIGAAFDHGTSRAGDPLLHTHVVTFNVTMCADGVWRSIDATPLYEHAKTAGYLYQAHLRHVLGRELGVRWTEVVNGTAEIRGVPDEVIAAFSKRRTEIEASVAASGYSSASAHQTSALATRHVKVHEPEPSVAIERWHTEAAELGFEAVQLETCVTRDVEGCVEVRVEPPTYSVEAIDEVAELISEKGITKMQSTFALRDVIRELSERSIDGADATTLCRLARRFIETADPVRLHVTGKADDVVITSDGLRRAEELGRFSSRELVAKEAEILDWAGDSLSNHQPSWILRVTREALSRHPELSEEQRDMVRTLTCGGQRMHLVAGDPGSGKTYAMGVAIEAMVAMGLPVIGAAISAEAGCELETATNLAERTGRQAGTIAKLLLELDDPEHGGFARDTVLVLDEASLIPTRLLHRLMTHVERARGSLILLGDPNQHGSVEAGGMYRHLVKIHSRSVVRLRDNQRQSLAFERLAIAQYRQDKVREALARYDEKGGIVRSKSASESYDVMATDWLVNWTNGDRSPMIAGPNFMRNELNRRACLLLKDAGTLSGPEVIVGEREFQSGDWVIAKHNDTRLRGTANGCVKNGSVGMVTATDVAKRNVSVDFEREGTVCIPASYLEEGHLDHAYARTTYSSQGKTFDSVGWQPTDISSFEEGYVAITRARNGTTIYLVEPDPESNWQPECNPGEWELDAGSVARALGRRRAKTTAHELEADGASRSSGIEL